MKRHVRIARVAAIGLVALALGCMSSNSVTNPVQTNTVNIQGFAFKPASITVPVGATVTWTNQDATAHTVTQDGGGFDSGALAQNASFSQTFTTKGTFHYHCSFHSFMVATVTVQ